MKPLINSLRGVPFYHLWYLYAMIGIVLMTPFIIRIKDEIGERKFSIVSWVLLVVANLSAWTSRCPLQWGVSRSICLIGYYLAGYQIRTQIKKCSHILGIISVLAGILAFLPLAALHGENLLGAGIGASGIDYISQFSPLKTAGSLLIFYGFTNIRVRCKAVSRLAGYTFYVYLIHAGIWDVITFVFLREDGLFHLGATLDVRIVLPAATGIVFLLSLTGARIYGCIWKCMDKDRRISKKLLQLVKLE